MLVFASTNSLEVIQVINNKAAEIKMNEALRKHINTLPQNGLTFAEMLDLEMVTEKQVKFYIDTALLTERGSEKTFDELLNDVCAADVISHVSLIYQDSLRIVLRHEIIDKASDEYTLANIFVTQYHEMISGSGAGLRLSPRLGSCIGSPSSERHLDS